MKKSKRKSKPKLTPRQKQILWRKAARARFKLYKERSEKAKKVWKIKNDKLEIQNQKLKNQNLILKAKTMMQERKIETVETQIQQMQLTLAKLGAEPFKETTARLHARLEAFNEKGMNPHQDYAAVLELASEFDMSPHDVFHEWVYLGLGGSMMPD